MYLDEFAARLHQLEDPYTDVHTRHAADQWLTQFRDSPHSWITAQSVLSSANSDPSLWPHAAQILAYKCKRQLAQIEAIEQRMLLLQTLSTALATLSSSSSLLLQPATASSSSAVTMALCVAISNLILQLPTLPHPLQTIGSLLNQQVMLEFLTVLPGECEDAYTALQASTANDAGEAAFLLKERAGEWCIEVGAWLYSLINSMVQSQPQLAAFLSSSSSSDPRSVPKNAAAVLPPLFIPSINCFSAWIKWGGLFSMEQQHWEYMLRLSSALLFGSGNGNNSPNAAAAAVVAGMEALSEAIERPAPATQGILLEICLRISQYITSTYPLGSTSTSSTTEQYRHMTHVFTTYCSTNAMAVASQTPEGTALRHGLLHLVALAGQKAANTSGPSGDNDDDEDEEEDSGGVPAVDALGDILEAIVDSSLASDQVTNSTAIGMGDDNPDGSSGNGNNFSNVQLLSGQERIQFTSTVLSVLLQYSQVPLAYLQGSTSTTPPSLSLPTKLKTFRIQAEWLLYLCGEILLADTFLQQLYSFFQTSGSTITAAPASTHASLQALEVCLYAIHKGGEGAFSVDSVDDFLLNGSFSTTPPAWLGPLISFYAAAKELDPITGRQQQALATGLNIFHFNLLSSFSVVAPPLMKALVSLPEHCRGLLELIFTQAGSAITASLRTPATRTTSNSYYVGNSEEQTENESVVEAAAQAVRAVLSSPAEVQAMALDAGAVGAIDSMLAALTTTTTENSIITPTTTLPYRPRNLAARKASQQLIIALVRILHIEDQHGAAAAAQEVLRNRALQPLITIATAAAIDVATNRSTLPLSQYVSSLASSFALLHASLEDTMALLNALESHIDLLSATYDEQHRPVVRAAVKDAVAACLTAWPNISTYIRITIDINN
jgi:hypothetical protein